MRKSKTLILTLFTLLFLASFSENIDKTEIWTKQTTIDKAMEFEKSLSKKVKILDKNVWLTNSIFPLADKYEIPKPIIIQREQSGFLPLYAQYFYSESDSIIRYISYDWEREMFGNISKKQEIWEEESKKPEQYNSEYERIKSTLIERFGEPTTQDTEPQKTESTSGRGYYLSRSTVWDTDEYYSKLNMVFGSTTFRIRWCHYWKN